MDPDRLELAYGRGVLPIHLPAGTMPTVIRKARLPTLPDALAAVRRAFDAPVASRSLSDLAKGRSSACILVCDITRPVPNGLFLRPMIETMLENGIPIDQIVVLVATGLHRPNLGEELAEVIGDPWVMQHVRVENHFARNTDGHIDLGRTRTRGTPVTINELFVKADLRSRHRSGRAALHGGLVRRTKSRCARRRRPRDHPDISFGSFHGRSAGRAVQPGRQPIA